jgi:oligopeptide/dipeptide ABC transporter ATP-binding protein
MKGLCVTGLTVGLRGQPIHLLRDVSFSVEPGEILGLVGESGSGKTVASLALLGLLPAAMEMRGGSITIDGEELVDPSTLEVRRSARQIVMIFQQPRSALNPTMRIGQQVGRVLRLHAGASRRAAENGAVTLLERVGIPGAARVARAYPHQLSGGMCQRVMIAMALACRPRVLVADEPTTALDVTIQAQVFELIRELAAEEGCGVLFITHDLAAVSELAGRVAVLYGGQLMEDGPTTTVLRHPHHPYTRFLLDATERVVGTTDVEAGVDFTLVGCRYGHRCPRADATCGSFPDLVQLTADHNVSCFHPLVAPGSEAVRS